MSRKPFLENDLEDLLDKLEAEYQKATNLVKKYRSLAQALQNQSWSAGLASQKDEAAKRAKQQLDATQNLFDTLKNSPSADKNQEFRDLKLQMSRTVREYNSAEEHMSFDEVKIPHQPVVSKMKVKHSNDSIHSLKLIFDSSDGAQTLMDAEDREIAQNLTSGTAVLRGMMGNLHTQIVDQGDQLRDIEDEVVVAAEEAEEAQVALKGAQHEQKKSRRLTLILIIVGVIIVLVIVASVVAKFAGTEKINNTQL